MKQEHGFLMSQVETGGDHYSSNWAFSANGFALMARELSYTSKVNATRPAINLPKRSSDGNQTGFVFLARKMF